MLTHSDDYNIMDDRDMAISVKLSAFGSGNDEARSAGMRLLLAHIKGREKELVEAEARVQPFAMAFPGKTVKQLWVVRGSRDGIFRGFRSKNVAEGYIAAGVGVGSRRVNEEIAELCVVRDD